MLVGPWLQLQDVRVAAFLACAVFLVVTSAPGGFVFSLAESMPMIALGQTDVTLFVIGCTVLST